MDLKERIYAKIKNSNKILTPEEIISYYSYNGYSLNTVISALISLAHDGFIKNGLKNALVCIGDELLEKTPDTKKSLDSSENSDTNSTNSSSTSFSTEDLTDALQSAFTFFED